MDRNLTNLKAPIGDKNVSLFLPKESTHNLFCFLIVHLKESAKQSEIR